MHKIFFFLVLVFIFISCNQKQEKIVPEIKWTKDQSAEMNKNFLFQEELDIKMFLENRKSWKMIKTGSGLRFYIYEEGRGEMASSGLDAIVKYKINLLNGTLCYQTDTLKTEIFKIDKSDIETGVQEGIKKMKIGDKAKLILPSHLAHGLLGDRDKIPPLNPLVIDIELVNLK